MPIPVIDIFAGPGGLGEGFSSSRDSTGNAIFKLCLSIEKDPHAHKTLELRSFFRKFPDGEAPEDYYRYVRNEGITRDELFIRHRTEADAAREEAWNFELREEKEREIDNRITGALRDRKIWVLLGGPPCQAYSVIGRNRMRGQNPQKYEADHRHHLYREYLRILVNHQPPVFVLENVRGLLSSRVNGESTFPRILHDLSLTGRVGTGYSLYPLVKRTSQTSFIAQTSFIDSDYLLYSEKLGIPQNRHRIIILGIRNDLGIYPDFLKYHDSYVTMWDAISDLPQIRSGLSRTPDNYAAWSKSLESFTQIADSQRLVPSDILSEMQNACKRRINFTLGGEFIPASCAEERSDWLKKHAWWFEDKRLHGFCNHIAKSHMYEDLTRYLFASCYAKLRGKSPTIGDMPPQLRPAHRNVNEAVTGKMFSDRFRVQIKGSPSTTIVSHISKDGHYFIHPDPVQCRSLTVREAARLQTFPDNYFFEGNRTAQYTQVGNAVPPLLAMQIADVVKGVLIKAGALQSNG